MIEMLHNQILYNCDLILDSVDSIALPIIVGVLVLAVLIFAFYLFPYLICESVGKKNNNSHRQQVLNGNMGDPIEGICSAIGK
jgi:hypothetical protein